MTDPSDHRALRESLGAYVLGHLPPDEVAVVEAHLQSCQTCPGELTELRPAAAALSLARASGARQPLAAADVPSSIVGSRIEDRIRSEQRRDNRARTTRNAAVCMLSAAAAAVVLVVGLRISRPDPLPTPAAPAAPVEAVSVVDEAAGITASAGLVNHTWGVEVKLVASGLQAGGQYVVTVTAADGAAYPAGAFVGTGAKAVKCNLNAGVLRAQATGFVVRDAAGAVVLRSEFAA